MKEKIIKILRNYSDFDEENQKESQEFNDMAGNFEKLINQEVERRIKERMPSEEWIASDARKRFTSNTGFFESAKYQGFIGCGKWLRSRLTNPGVNDSQKTEGGEG